MLSFARRRSVAVNARRSVCSFSPDASLRLNHTNLAQAYFEKAMANRQRSLALSISTNALTITEMADAIERGSRDLTPN
jgi:hypothetical protein